MESELKFRMFDIICMTTFGYGTCVLWICSYEMNPFRKMKNSWFLICFTNCLNKKPFTKTKTQKNVWLTLFNQLSQFWNGFLIYFPCFTQFSQFWKPVTYSHIFLNMYKFSIYFQYFKYIYMDYILNKCWINFQHFE